MLLFTLIQRLFALASIAVLGAGAWLIWTWLDLERDAVLLKLAEPSDHRLYWGLGLLIWSVIGRLIILGLLAKPGPRVNRERSISRPVSGVDGSRLQVEHHGAPDGPILLFTHGWGLNSRVWGEARRDLGQRFQVMTWDLPGMGRSKRPDAFSIDGFAEDLGAVIANISGRDPILLVGHSIGGMTVQTLAARHPRLMDDRVAGMVLENTTHQNPLHTMVLAPIVSALQPLWEVVMRLDILFSPVVWLMNWQSYFSGSMHIAMRLAGFGTRPTYEQLDATARMAVKNSPANQARGNLAMFHWSVTSDLGRIALPTLVFTGGRDLVTKDHAGDDIAKAVPGAKLSHTPAAGHMGPVECSNHYNQTIAAFANEAFERRARAAVPAPTGRG